jgi:hypothetical protein
MNTFATVVAVYRDDALMAVPAIKSIYPPILTFRHALRALAIWLCWSVRCRRVVVHVVAACVERMIVPVVSRRSRPSLEVGRLVCWTVPGTRCIPLVTSSRRREGGQAARRS